VGFDLPAAETKLKPGVWDAKRRVLAFRLG